MSVLIGLACAFVVFRSSLTLPGRLTQPNPLADHFPAFSPCLWHHLSKTRMKNTRHPAETLSLVPVLSAVLSPLSTRSRISDGMRVDGECGGRTKRNRTGRLESLGMCVCVCVCARARARACLVTITAVGWLCHVGLPLQAC